MKNIVLIFLSVFVSQSFARTEPPVPAGPLVTEIKCTIKGDRMVEAAGVAAKLNLPTPSADKVSQAVCQRITYKKFALISVKYVGVDNVSNNHAPSKVNVYQVFQLVDGKAIEAFAANVDVGSMRWMEFRGVLNARIAMSGDQNQPMWGQGWVLNPKTSQFEDFIVFAIENNWPF